MKRSLIVFFITLTAYLLTAGGHLYSPDEEIVFRTTRALATGQGLGIEPLASHEFTRKPHPLPDGRPRRTDGREYAQYGVAQPFCAVPFYLAGAALGRRIGSDATWQRWYGPVSFGAQQFGYKPTAAELAPRWAVSWFNIFVGALLATLLYLVCLEITGSPAGAAWAALLYALGSLAWPHSRPFFTESFATLWIVLAWYGLLRAASPRATRGGALAWCLLAGAAAGIAALTRMDSVLAYPGLALLLVGPVVCAARVRRQWFGLNWAAFCLPAAIAGGVLLGLNWLHFGGPFQTGYSDQPEGVKFATPVMAGLFGFLFSAGKGLFFFSPALALSFLGWRPLARAARERDRFATLLWAVVAAVVIPLVVHAKWQNWPGGWCWGPRHIFIIHPFLAIPVAAWLGAILKDPAWAPVGRVTALVALLAGIGVQLLGSSQDFIYYHQRFFRTPGDPNAFYVIYDPLDQFYWGHFFQMQFRRGPEADWQTIPLVPPRPIQDSLYLPQWSVWEGYPRLLREGALDNFWVNLARPPARPVTDRPVTEAPQP